MDDNESIDRNIFFISRFSWFDYRKMHRHLSARENLEQHQEFSDEDIKMAGLSSLPSIPNAAEKDFKKMLTSIGRKDKQLEICFNLWYYAQHEGDEDYEGKTYKDYFQENVLNGLNLNKKKQEYATAQLETYMSNMPRWTLRGHSYNEFNNQN